MVDHTKSADQIVFEAIAIHIDSEGMNSEMLESVESALYWALDQVGKF